MKKALFHWSGGKDSSLALYYTLQQKEYEVSSLLTTISEKYDRISMHGVCKSVLKQQTKSLGIPLDTLSLPEGVTMTDYDQLMEAKLLLFKQKGLNYSIYGDIFLEDLKKYREDNLKKIGIQGVFPIWLKNTTRLVKEFIDLGFKAIVVCANARLLGEEFVGRIIDQSFLDDLPPGVDPAGENGEFHSFVYDGPIFSQAIPIEIGEKVLRSYTSEQEDSTSDWDHQFWYCDLLLKTE